MFWIYWDFLVWEFGLLYILGIWDLGYDIGLKVNYLSKLWRSCIAKDVMQLNQLNNSTE